MTKNMGTADRAIRLLLAVALLYVALGTNMLGSGVLFYTALAAAAVATLTAFVGNCPLYSIIGLKTCRDC